MPNGSPKKLYPLRDACKVLGVSYPALKQWIYKGKIHTTKTAGGYHGLCSVSVAKTKSGCIQNLRR